MHRCPAGALGLLARCQSIDCAVQRACEIDQLSVSIIEQNDPDGDRRRFSLRVIPASAEAGHESTSAWATCRWRYVVRMRSIRIVSIREIPPRFAESIH